MNGLFRPEWSTLKKLMFLQSMGGETWSTISGNPVFFTAKAAPLRKLKVAFSPVQDLHGYDSPWPAGGGKNLIVTNLAWLKLYNPYGTWNGTTYTYNGISFADDFSPANLGTVKVSGTFSTQTNFTVGYFHGKANTEYIINGVPQDPSWTTFQMYAMAGGNKYAVVNGTTFTVTEDGDYQVVISVYGTIPTLEFKPMIRLSSVSDATFAPYSNICPISGWSSLTVYHSGADTSNPQTISISLGQTVYSGTLDVLTGVVTVDKVGITLTKDSDLSGFNVGTGNASATYAVPYAAKVGSASSSKNGAISSTGIENPKYWSTARPNEIPDGGDMSFGLNANFVRFYRLNVGAYQTSEAWKAGFPDTTLVYTLATPITIQLTPQEVSSLLGENNMWSDGDSLAVEYRSN